MNETPLTVGPRYPIGKVWDEEQAPRGFFLHDVAYRVYAPLDKCILEMVKKLGFGDCVAWDYIDGVKHVAQNFPSDFAPFDVKVQVEKVQFNESCYLYQFPEAVEALRNAGYVPAGLLTHLAFGLEYPIRNGSVNLPISLPCYEQPRKILDPNTGVIPYLGDRRNLSTNYRSVNFCNNSDSSWLCVYDPEAASQPADEMSVMTGLPFPSIRALLAEIGHKDPTEEERSRDIGAFRISRSQSLKEILALG
jgi:hypothetical protein